jgi:hypothetical protein
MYVHYLFWFGVKGLFPPPSRSLDSCFIPVHDVAQGVYRIDSVCIVKGPGSKLRRVRSKKATKCTGKLIPKSIYFGIMQPANETDKLTSLRAQIPPWPGRWV